ncbi:hypothetical protein GCM10009566_43680 [Streptomyces murinus]
MTLSAVRGARRHEGSGDQQATLDLVVGTHTAWCPAIIGMLPAWSRLPALLFVLVAIQIDPAVGSRGEDCSDGGDCGSSGEVHRDILSKITEYP